MRVSPEPGVRACAWERGDVLRRIGAMVCIWLLGCLAENGSAFAAAPETFPAEETACDMTGAETLKQFGGPANGRWGLNRENGSESNRILRQSEAGPGLKIFLSHHSYVNFDFSVRLRAGESVAKIANWKIGVLFRWQDARNHYRLRITPANVGLARYSSEPAAEGQALTAKAPKEQWLFLLPLQGASRGWHTVKIVCRGERITVNWDGILVRTLSDAGVGFGRVGFFTAGISGDFDDAEVKALAVPGFHSGVKPESDVMRTDQTREWLIYYRNPKSGDVVLRLLDSQGRLAYLLVHGPRPPGLQSVLWEGQNYLGQSLPKGTYLLDLQAGSSRHSARLKLE